MDAPVLTAVISVSGTLLGAIVGGCLTMYSNFFLNKRRERAEFRMSCRLIAGELVGNLEIISDMIEVRRWSLLELTTDAWKEHRQVLASYLPSEVWWDVQEAAQAVRVARNVGEGHTEEFFDEEAELLSALQEKITRARTSLQPYLEKPRRRLL